MKKKKHRHFPEMRTLTHTRTHTYAAGVCVFVFLVVLQSVFQCISRVFLCTATYLRELLQITATICTGIPFGVGK